MSTSPQKPRPLRQRIGNHKKTIAMNNDTFERVDAFARGDADGATLTDIDADADDEFDGKWWPIRRTATE